MVTTIGRDHQALGDTGSIQNGTTQSHPEPNNKAPNFVRCLIRQDEIGEHRAVAARRIVAGTEQRQSFARLMLATQLIDGRSLSR